MTFQWPIQIDEWTSHCECEAAYIVQGRLSQYPALRSFRQQTASLAVGRALEIAKYLRQHDDYFSNCKEFCRWLCVVSYREALRLVLKHEPIEAALNELSVDARRLLHWAYIDQLTHEQAARILNLTCKTRRLFDDCEAGKRIALAYEQLCAVIARRFPTETLIKHGTHRDYSSVFPIPPTHNHVSFGCPPKGETK